ncbi:glycosyltransferase family 2 protein [Bifidobacterium saguinibicoloris]|uniref:glycosyltransferase family 2 protein n=1 Tax=Bifidobacterium saguinibicoloris TaxID=2834433 RepID=UPI001C582464|nr:glycosyltransferase family 2 protein [Bifidobacterium saguinibicoloris]MBW3080029.1 glycosyltransferase family 2 protein [Bifidobacterium saguinibicoloris]
MHVFVQIPCLNEAGTLPLVMERMPKRIPGVDELDVMIIDDGCTDDTVAVARRLGIRHIVRHNGTMGLARAFRDGVDYALKHGADIVVNTDGDNQYPSERIGDLVRPIIEGRADIVVGDRQTATIKEFSPFKRLMQRFGSWVVNRAAGTHIPDAASGFRAYSKRSLLQLNILTEFSYCMETIIQAGYKRIAITSVPIVTNPKTRRSRLFHNIFEHMGKSAGAIIRSFLMFRAHSVFTWSAAVPGAAAAVIFIRYLLFYFAGQGHGHTQSLLLGVMLFIWMVVSLLLLIVSEVMRAQRRLQEDELERIKELEYSPASRGLWQHVDATDGAARDAARDTADGIAGRHGETGETAWGTK